MKGLRFWIYAAALAAVTGVAGAAHPVGQLQARGTVQLELGQQRLAVPSDVAQLVTPGAVIRTPGDDGWGLLRIDGVGRLEVGPHSAVAVDRVGDTVQVRIVEGGARYQLDPGAGLMLEAGGVTFLAGSQGRGLTAVALGATAGAVAAGDGEVYAASIDGKLVAVTPSGEQAEINGGQTGVFAPAPDGPMLAQVGSTGAASSGAASGKRRGFLAWWGSLGAFERFLFVAAVIGGGVLIYDQIDDDDDLPASPR